METGKATKGAGGRRGRERKKAVTKSVTAGLQFPMGRIARFMKKRRYAQRTGTGAPIYLLLFLNILPLKFWNWPKMQHVTTRRTESTQDTFNWLRNDEELGTESTQKIRNVVCDVDSTSLLGLRDCFFVKSLVSVRRRRAKTPKLLEPPLGLVRSGHQSQPPDLSKWDPHHFPSQPSKPIATLSIWSPIARFIVDAFRKNQSHWGPPIVFELRKLRSVTPELVAKVLKLQTEPAFSFKVLPFGWVMLIKLTRHTNSESFNPIVVSYAEMKKMDEFYELLVQMKKLGSSVMDDLAEFWQWKCLRT
uniref:Uncharacterized protein n=1 Tax=Cannabis sativa TaxID=3483 RepID=A0A803PPA0_CANSA